MKRWNKKGSTHAKQHMGELRDRKKRLALSRLQGQFNAAAGVHVYEAVMAVMFAHGFSRDMTIDQRIAWFEKTIPTIRRA